MATKASAKASGKQTGPTKIKFLNRWIDYLKLSYGELKKVSWPKKDEIIGSTVVVIVFCIVLALFLGIIDISVNSIVKLILGGETPFHTLFN